MSDPSVLAGPPAPERDVRARRRGPVAPIPDVSVVIPSWRRPDLLERCLAALAVQDLDADRYEIIVVDDAASGAAAAVVARIGADAPCVVRYLAVSGRRGPAAARNVGWRAARGAVIAFTDEDCIPDTRWLAAGLREMSRGLTGVRGRLLVPTPPAPTEYERTISWLETAEFVTANCFYRKDALQRAGGFDERFTAAWREDRDLYFTLLEQGGRFGYAERSVVVHPVRRPRWGVSLKEQRKTVFNALLFKKHRALYHSRIGPGPWRYYAITGLLLVALFAAPFGRLRLAALALAGWAFLTGMFCGDRLRHTSRSPGHVVEMVVTSILIPPVSLYWRWRGALRYRVFFR